MKEKILTLFSSLLIVCIFVSSLSGTVFALDLTESSNSETTLDALEYTELTVNNIPDAVGIQNVLTKAHIGRLHQSEGVNLNQLVFLNADGTKTLYSFEYPVKYIDDTGAIKDISLKLSSKASTSDFTSVAGETVTRFSRNLANGIHLSGNNVYLKLVPILNNSNLSTSKTESISTTAISTINPIAQQIDNKTVAYQYNDKTSFEYSLTYSGFKEDIVVTEYTGQTQYHFSLFTNGLTLTNIDDSYYLVDSDDNIKATIGDVIVFTADERNNAFGKMAVKEIVENNQYVITIILDDKYLSDPKTVYPIRIDPTIEINYDNNGTGAIQDVTLNSEAATTASSGSLYIGKRTAYGIGRVLMKFPSLDLSIIDSSSQITSAEVQIRDMLCESTEMSIYCNVFNGSAWNESTVNWTNANPSQFGALADVQTVSYAIGNAKSNPHRYAFNILGPVRGWKTGVYDPNKGIIFRTTTSVENSTSNNVRTFASYNRASYKPFLTVTYDDNIGVSNISLSETSKTIYVGEYFQLTATITPSNATNTSVSWVSSRETVATVSANGRVTAISAGNTLIVATAANGDTASCYITVVMPNYSDTIGLESDATYFIKNMWTEKYLDVTEGYDINFTEVLGYSYHGASNQQWRLDICGNNRYRLFAECSDTDKVLDITGDSVDIYTNNNADYQKFTIVRQETMLYGTSGQYYIKYGNKYLTLSDDAQTLVLTDTALANSASLWCFEEVSKGYADLYNSSDFTWFYQICENWYSTTMSSMGYLPYYYIDADRDTAFDYLKIASIYLHNSHANPGNILFYENYAISINDVQNLPENELAGLRCFISLGCEAAATQNNGDNLIQALFDKGAQFALGFVHDQIVLISDQWLEAFLYYSSLGNTIQDSLEYADTVEEYPFYASDIRYYRGDIAQRLSR